MSNQDIDDAIENIENFLFENETGEKLFLDFAKENKEVFKKAKLSHSTENSFEFTELHNKFQKIFEGKLEEILVKSKTTTNEFFEEAKKRIDEGDQEISLFISMINQITSYDSFLCMMANLINKV